MTFLFFAIVISLVGFLIAATLVNDFRLRRHRGIPRTVFIAKFAQQGIPESISAAVYDHYQREFRHMKFEVSPNDDLGKVYGRYDEAGYEDDIDDLFQALGLRYPRELILQEWQTPLATIRDMVLWLDWIRQHQSSTASSTGCSPSLFEGVFL